MTADEQTEAIRELERLRWTYDPKTKTFSNDEGTISWDEALALVPTVGPHREQEGT